MGDRHGRGRLWRAVASSAEGHRLAAVVNGGIICTPLTELIFVTSTSTSGTAGYLTGAQSTAVELQYIGGGQFMSISYLGKFSIY